LKINTKRKIMCRQGKSENIFVSGSVRPTIIIFILVLVVGVFAFSCWATRQKTPEITYVKVYFRKFKAESIDCICKDPVIRKIPKTTNVERAALVALEELIKGPTEEEREKGYGGCIPAGTLVAEYKEWYMKIVKVYQEDQKIDYFGKKFLSPDGEFTPWGDRVAVKSVKIKDGIAYADFSKELYSYGGGSCRVEAIETAIVNTLKQFPCVEKVVILVEGREAEIQP